MGGLVVSLRVRRFVCEEESCERMTFAEHVPALTRRFRRRTKRLRSTPESAGSCARGPGWRPDEARPLLRLIRHGLGWDNSRCPLAGTCLFAYSASLLWDTAFTDPHRADDELAHHYLARLDQRAATFYAAVPALVRDAGTDRATVLHA
ncbi:hypothetical protein [Streptomyces sp. NPDC048636]|uniref:hypothetical protein n=1 Tax=Streptomyces sp. NPDC048636 TaxID=3155762 RepID=UPI00342871CF